MQFIFPKQCCSCLAPSTTTMPIDILEKGQPLLSPPVGTVNVPVCAQCRQRLSRLQVIAVIVVALYILAGGTLFLLALKKIIPVAFILGGFIAVLSARKLFFLVCRTPARFKRSPDGDVVLWSYSFRNKTYQDLFIRANPLIS